MVKIDLSDAYWSLPIANQSRKFRRFRWQGTLMEFLVLPFGLGPGPRKFTKLVKVPIAILRRLNIRVVIYLDDMLLIGSSMKEIITARDSTLFILQSLGFTINLSKSSLTPSRSCEFLGMLIQSINMTISLLQEKAFKIHCLCRDLLSRNEVSVREIASAIGKLYATSPAISHAPLKIRSLQRDLILAQHQNKSYGDHILLSPLSILEIKWWWTNVLLAKGSPLKISPSEMIIYTDASTSQGWGVHMEGCPSTGGIWSIEEQQLHINILELLAVEIALRTFLRIRHADSIHIRNRQVRCPHLPSEDGGTKSPELCEISTRIWEFLMDRGTTLTASWIPSVLNVIADERSRRNPNSSEWALNSQVFHRICEVLGRPSIDAFASRIMHRLPAY